MSLRSKRINMIGAVGYLLSAFLTIVGLALMSSFYVSIAAVIVVSIFTLIASFLVMSYFFCTASATKDTMIKYGGFIAGGGYAILLLAVLVQLMGIFASALSLIGVIAAIAGAAMVVYRFMQLFKRDSIIVVLCIISFIGMLLSFIGLFTGSIISGTGDLFMGAGMGSLLLYFRSHNIFY